MHAPFAIKKAIAKGDSKLQVEWESHVKDMQQSCLVTRRQPPQRSACPKPDCASVFEGPTSWDEWTEHVGRHMEKGEASRLGVDRLLAKWALAENIIERREEDGEYRLCGTSTGADSSNGSNGKGGSNGTEKEPGNGTHNDGHHHNHVPPGDHLTAGIKRDRDHDHDHYRDRDQERERDREQEDNSSTIIAASTMVDKMEVDG